MSDTPVPLHPVLLAMLVLGWAGNAAAQGAEGPPRIRFAATPSAVTVFPDQATVTRTGTVELPAGDSLLLLPDIPASVLADSVTARGRAEAAVAIGAVELRQVVFDPRAVDGRRADLNTRLRALEDEIAAVDGALAAQAAQLALIQRLTGGFAESQRRVPQMGEAPRLAADPATWREAWAAVRDGTAEANEASRLAAIRKRGLEDRRIALQAELNALGTTRPAGQEIAVAVHADAATRLELSVSYQLPGAQWQPVYEVRLDTGTGRVALRQEAIVTQRTGEDWPDAVLTLSTARPSAETKPPELQPWRIALIDPAARDAMLRQSERRQAPSAAPAPMMAPATVAPVQPQYREVAAVAATVASAGFAVEYRIPGRASVPADGTERRLRIGDLTAEAALSVRTVPRVDPRGFLQARFPHPAPAPTLPGRAGLYLDGVFVGRVALPLLRPEEEVNLAFGADDQVRVTYAPQVQRRGSEGNILSGRTTSRTTEALITVRNYHPRPMSISVFDQLPVSGEDPLTVTLQAEPAPTARDVDNRPGVLAWTATYAPGEERRIRFGFTVTAPRDREVSGLRE